MPRLISLSELPLLHSTMLQVLLIVESSDVVFEGLEGSFSRVVGGHNEESLQHSLVTVEERKLAKANKSEKISKANFVNRFRPTKN